MPLETSVCLSLWRVSDRILHIQGLCELEGGCRYLELTSLCHIFTNEERVQKGK